MQHFKLDLKNRPALDQLESCRRIVTALGEQPPDKRDTLPLDALNQQVDDADAAFKLVERLRGELRAALTTRNVTLKKLRAAVTRSAIGYSGIVAGDAAALLAGGLQVAAAKSPVGRPPAPESLVAETAADEGAARLSWKRPVRRATFIVQAARSPEADADWKQVAIVVRQGCVVRDLEPGVKYWFRVAAINAHGQGPWSQIASTRAG